MPDDQTLVEQTEDEATTDTTDDAQEAPTDEVEDWRKDFDADKAADRIRKLQSEAKNLRTRAKAAEDKAAGVDQKDQQITSLQAQVIRERVGRKLTLPDELVDRLRGDTEEEMLADAEKLVGLLRAPTVSRKPQEALRGGGDPKPEPEETDLRKLADRMFRR